MRKILLSLLVTATGVLWAQDTCETAVAVTDGTYTVAAVDGTAPTLSCNTGDGTAAEWYSYTNTTDDYLLVTINTDLTVNEGGDTRVSVYSGDCSSLVCVGGADDTDTNYLTTLEVLFPAGETYYIAFDNYWSDEGFDFEMSSVVYELDCSTSIPFTEEFDDSITFDNCYTTEDVDGNDISWTSQQNLDLDGDGTIDTFATNGSGTTEENDYLISPAFDMEGGTTYGLTAHYNGYSQEDTSVQYMTAVLLDAPNSSANVVATIFEPVNVTNGVFETLETEAMESTGTFTPETDGTYYVAFIATTVEDHTSGFILLFDYTITENLSVNEVELASISAVYPNPTRDIVNIRLAEDFDAAHTTITLTSVTGQTIGKFTQVEQINVAKLPAGVYLMTITDGNKTERKKLIKK